MIEGEKLNIVGKILLKTQFRIVLFFAYVVFLGYIFFVKHDWKLALIIHLLFVVIYIIVYFWEDFLKMLFAPILVIIFPVQNYFLMRYLKKFKQNVPVPTVIILGQLDWFKFRAWLKPNFFKDDIRAMIKYLEKKNKDFSFYTKASLEDVEKIMANKDIKEVFFFGHGDSHVFQLNTSDYLYYCEFNNPDKYKKDFIHQVHCGREDGKSLIEYLVPVENRDKCFFFRKAVYLKDIIKWFKDRT